ncbi:putative quinol monooxygenase [Flammeovirgaceae bacterium SG7u.111]|nr:putative quinol monooxygenase [Flammeovirgaceae bacterium SG7u.132]WPO37886.1 putative quinol monooxygenase [Flammeovirgaceae bacterium SG7u.111]
MAEQKLTIVARILAKAEKRALVKSELLKLIEVTRAEEGCINYDLHQDNENENLFLFFENWESKELWQKHMENTHLAEYVKATDGAVEEFVLNEMTHIG